VQTPEAMRRRFRIDVRTKTEVTAIDTAKKEVTVRDLEKSGEYTESYDFLVLSPGAEPVRPPISGIESGKVYTLRNMKDMDSIIARIDEAKPERAVVVGAGYIGLEMTEALRDRKIGVTLVELAPQVMAAADPEMTAPIKQQLELHGVDLRLNASITSISETGSGLSVLLSTGDKVECGLLLLNTGVKPETKLAREAGLAIGGRGGIVVDEHMRTSDQSIFAVGDAVEVTDLAGGFQTMIPLAGPANRQGRIAADAMFGRDSAYRKTQGTAICKVFDLAIAMTGMNEKTLKRLGRSYDKVYVHPANHASYYPGASPIGLKLLFDPSSGLLLGAQATGAEGVDKRIDVLAVALRAGMTVYDLEHLELTYAPPYGSAKDPVNYAGFVAANALRGDVALCHYEDVANPREDQYILDVRTSAEVAVGTIPGAHNIPLDDLRDRLDELPRHKELLVTCQVGLRGYLACRILSQNGFRCRNLSGGYKTYLAFADALPEPEPPTTEMREDSGEEPPAVSGPDIVREIDATGLQCPGPIMRLKQEMDTVPIGRSVMIRVSDPGFIADVPAWCNSTGNKLVEKGSDNGTYYAVITRHFPESFSAPNIRGKKQKTIVVFSGDLDRVLAALIIANGAAAMGSDVTLFFTFWGLNALRRPDSPPVKKTFIESMFGAMMPRGADKLKLSTMNMGGLGSRLMKGIMRDKNVDTLPDLIGAARAAGIRLVACAMSMDVMGIRKEELIDGVEVGGVALYLDEAEKGNVNLFV
jgi:NADPH-dependent 2,4-dienoyl-CoA reductase/sulfur reductase-like enzyme/peroxiredoxin family protein/TusA-related sulfurtransferase/rhodanese-related sulfurtransferase